MSTAIRNSRTGELDAATLAELFRAAGGMAPEWGDQTWSYSVTDWQGFERSAFDTYYSELEQATQFERAAFERLEARLEQIPVQFRSEPRSRFHPRSMLAGALTRRGLAFIAAFIVVVVGAGWWAGARSDVPGTAGSAASHAGHVMETSTPSTSSPAESDISTAELAVEPAAEVDHSEHMQTGTEPAAAAPGATVSDAAGATPVRVELGEFFVRPGAATVQAGTANFAVHNAGKVEHELMMIRQDQVEGSIAAMSSKDLHDLAVTSVHGLGSGDKREVDVRLQPGTYVLFCNLPGHFAGGQRATITVV